MKKIILITGGQRSGKSEKAEALALSLSTNPVYLATAHVWDDEFRERVRRHQERRGPEWTNIEEELYLSRHHLTGRVVVVDCVTLWLTNLLYNAECRTENGEFATASEGSADFAAVANSLLSTLHSILELAKREFDAFTQHDATYIFVTNEIGLGGVSDNALQRKFTDLQGWMNQYIAQKADEVILMVSGIEMKIK